MPSLCVFAPAKINLFLAVTGLRPDGFHDLISLVTPLDWGDNLWLEPRPDLKDDTLACDCPDVPADASNLVLKAAAAYRRNGGGAPFIHFSLQKAVPAGAGLGGGSSDAAAALRGLNHLATRPLSPAALLACAAEVGSDVPLFLEGVPVVMRGRGEINQVLPSAAREALRRLSLLVFKPPFGVPTAWAYRRLKERGQEWYLQPEAAEGLLAPWLANPARETLPLRNNLERPVFEKFAALPALLDELREKFGLRCGMSGSGSACFVLLEAGAPRPAIEQVIRTAWGSQAVVRFCRPTGV